MNFSENLYRLRQQKGLSQEQLAETLGVSRQSVSKWESGAGYPEMDKILALCEIFSCTMDELIRGEVKKESDAAKKAECDALFGKVSKLFGLAVFLIVFGAAVLVAIAGVDNALGDGMYTILSVCFLLLLVAIAVAIFILQGNRLEDYKKNNPDRKILYTKEEREKVRGAASLHTAIAVAAIILAVAGMLIFYSVWVEREAELEQSVFSTLPVGILIFVVAISCYFFVSDGMLAEKFEEGKRGRRRRDLPEAISGIIMLTATAIYLLCGFLWSLWNIAWVVFPIGGIICAGVNIIFSVFQNKEEKTLTKEE